MGPINTPFDLVFVLCFLAALGVLTAAAVQSVRGRWRRALRLLAGWIMGVAVYFAALITISLTTPRRVLQWGEARCFDDWCVTAERASRQPAGDGQTITVGLRVWSRARRVSQRVPDAGVFLTDAQGRHWDPLPDPAAASLGVMLAPLEAVETSRTFQVPADARELGLVVNHGSGPANIVIGDEASLFHKRTMYLLDQAR